MLHWAGVDVNSKDNYGRTPMYHAAFNGLLEMVRMLKNEFQVDVNSKNNTGRTPMHSAAQEGTGDGTHAQDCIKILDLSPV